MTKLIVDGKEIDVPPEYTLLQACEAAGAEIPRFCFHERLSIAGNCPMGLGELAGPPQPACPVGGRGGACALQDRAMASGAAPSRFAENKRAVEDKYIGALVK